MYKVIPFLSALLLLSCSDLQPVSNVPDTVGVSSTFTQATSETPASGRSTNNWTEIIIDTLPFHSNTKQLLRLIKEKPDSVVTVIHDCGGYFDSGKAITYYYGGTVFEAENDTVVLKKLNFEEGRFTLRTTKMLFDQQTTLTLFERVYPGAIAMAYDWLDVSDRKTYKLLRVLPKKDYDDEWVLKFYDGKLIEIAYWIPC